MFWREAVASPAGLLPAEPITVLDFTFADGVTARFDQAKPVGQDTLEGALTLSSDGVGHLWRVVCEDDWVSAPLAP